MPNRIRLAQEELPDRRRSPVATPGLQPDQADRVDQQPGETNAILRLQQTHGNAYVRRYLKQAKADQGARRSVWRAPAPDSSSATATPAPSIYFTATIHGDAVKGTSKRPGHEGQFEGLSLSKLAEDRRPNAPQEDNKDANTEDGKQPAKLRVKSVVLTKMFDESTPIFADAAIRGIPVDFHFDMVKRDADKETVYLSFDFKESIIYDQVSGTNELLTIYPSNP